jgi:hypothetical protein
MKTMFRFKWVLIPPLVLLAIVGFSYITMLLWNGLLPELFHLPVISFWQAIGILILSRLIFGGFGGARGHHGRHFRNHVREKWEHMTPEEREKFMQHHSHDHNCCRNNVQV